MRDQLAAPANQQMSRKQIKTVKIVMCGQAFVSPEIHEHAGGTVTKTEIDCRILTAMGYVSQGTAQPKPYAISGRTHSFDFVRTPEKPKRYRAPKPPREQGEEDAEEEEATPEEEDDEPLTRAQLLLRELVCKEADVILLGYDNAAPAEVALLSIANVGQEALGFNPSAPIVLVGVGKRTDESVPLDEVDVAAEMLVHTRTVRGISKSVVETEAAVAAKLDFLWDFTSSAAAIEDPSKLPKADLRKLLKEYEEENTICSRSMRRQFDKIVAACGDAHERQEALAAQRVREAAKKDRERFKATCPCCCCCPCALRHGTSGGGFYLSV